MEKHVFHFKPSEVSFIRRQVSCCIRRLVSCCASPVALGRLDPTEMTGSSIRTLWKGSQTKAKTNFRITDKTSLKADREVGGRGEEIFKVFCVFEFFLGVLGLKIGSMTFLDLLGRILQ